MTVNQFETLAGEIRNRLARLPEHKTAAIRMVRREFSKRLAKATPAFVVQLSLHLLKNEKAAPRFFAYELVLHHRKALGSLNSRTLKLLGEGINSWDTVDTFACYLSGPAWREHQVSNGLIVRWARSRDRWWRRAAVVSTVPLNNKARGGNGDTVRTLEICNLVVHDRDDMVVKALSWALRELAKRDAKAVEKFLREKQASLSPRVVREVNNKLRTGLKNPAKRVCSR
jgi:3-methyladenine DNA glycosylase AlkD